MQVTHASIWTYQPRGTKRVVACLSIHCLMFRLTLYDVWMALLSVAAGRSWQLLVTLKRTLCHASNGTGLDKMLTLLCFLERKLFSHFVMWVSILVLIIKSQSDSSFLLQGSWRKKLTYAHTYKSHNAEEPSVHSHSNQQLYGTSSLWLCQLLQNHNNVSCLLIPCSFAIIHTCRQSDAPIY